MSELDDLHSVVHRLRAPGGCPWDAEQTHASLVTYLVEETFELVDALEAGSDDDVKEELGDVLYQVLFHADIAEAEGRFSLDDVAAAAASKMRSRHPHVFGGADEVGERTVDEVVDGWDALKAKEKQHRESVLDGIAAAGPALQTAQKVLGRAAKGGFIELEDAIGLESEEQLGSLLLAIAHSAKARGLDAERALRLATRDVADEIRETEATRRTLEG